MIIFITAPKDQKVLIWHKCNTLVLIVVVAASSWYIISHPGESR